MGAMTTLKRATASILMGARWLLLAVGTAAVNLAEEAKETADWLRQ